MNNCLNLILDELTPRSQEKGLLKISQEKNFPKAGVRMMSSQRRYGMKNYFS